MGEPDFIDMSLGHESSPDLQYISPFSASRIGWFQDKGFVACASGTDGRYLRLVKNKSCNNQYNYIHAILAANMQN